VTGGVPSIEGYFARASVVMAPVRLGGGMRRKVLEAMALGKPVVTTRLGTEGLAGAPADHPVVVADAVDALAEGTVKLLVEPHTRHELGARARSFVARHHSWTAYADRLDELYDEVRRR
jgi:glycosyltransferase involved in cell wall biosynthesis